MSLYQIHPDVISSTSARAVSFFFGARHLLPRILPTVSYSWMPRQRLRYRSNRESLAERGERGVDNLDAHWPTMRDLLPSELPCLARLAWTRRPHTGPHAPASVPLGMSGLSHPPHPRGSCPRFSSDETEGRSHFSSSCLCTKYTPMLFYFFGARHLRILRRAPSPAPHPSPCWLLSSYFLRVTKSHLKDPPVTFPGALGRPRTGPQPIRGRLSMDKLSTKQDD